MGNTINLMSNDFPNDDEIIKQILSGNKQEEDILYRKYYNRLIIIVAPGIINIDDVKDIVQDTMIIAITNIKNGKYTHKQTLFSYIQGISWILRKKFLKNTKYHSPINEYENIIEINYPQDSFEIIKEKRIGFIIQAVNSLDKVCNKLLTYSFFDKLKPRQIVGLMSEFDTSVQVSKKKFKCLEKLKRKINKIMQNEK
jgi:DNA-directed RNA polymerase specialized sigma24 family protein